MGRILQFKDQEAVEKAMILFWEKGYEHTSLADLLACMSIGNSSFYNTFGNKKTLFMKTLDHYNSELTNRVAELKVLDLPAKKKIRSIFRYSIDRQQSKKYPRGCFIINSVSSDALEDKDIAEQVRGYLDDFERSLEEILKCGIRTGELNAAIDPRHCASVLNFYLQGLMKLALVGYSNMSLRQPTDYFLDSLGL